MPPERTQLRLISESYRIEAADADGLARITATLARGNIINRNQRYYSTTVLQKAAIEARDRVEAGKLTGLMDHPNYWNGDGDKGRPERIVVKWESIDMNGDDLVGSGLIVDTALGRDLYALHQAKVHLGLSTNAYAASHYEPARLVPAQFEGDEDDWVEVIDEMQLLTVDVVNDPSNAFAAIQAEAKARRESARREETRMTDTEKELQTRLAELRAQNEALTAERDEAVKARDEAATAAAQERRGFIAERVIAANPHLAPAAQAAIRLTVRNADSDDAAEEAAAALAAAIPQAGNGSNHVPTAEERKTGKNPDPLREAREALTN